MSSTIVDSELQESAELQAAAFQALEQRVLRAIELLRNERDQRTAAEHRARSAEEHFLELEIRLDEQSARMAEQASQNEDLNGRIAQYAEQIRRLEGDLSQLNGERDQVRQRVERLLQQLDEISV